MKKNILNDLKDDCMFNLSMGLEYASEVDFDENDLSQSYAIHELICSFEVYKRALDTKSKKDNNNLQSYLYFETTIKELLLNLKKLGFEKDLSIFLNNYYSEKQYLNILSAIKKEIDFGFEKEVQQSDIILDYFLIYDKINLIINCEILNSQFPKIISEVSRQKENIEKIFNQFSHLWFEFSTEIVSTFNALLIPIDESHNYWNKFVEGELIKRKLLEKQNKKEKEFSTKTKKIPDISLSNKKIFLYEFWKQQHKKGNLYIPKIENPGNNKPRLYWSSSDDYDIDYLINTLMSEKKSVNEMMNVIESLEFDTKTKKELLITLYILFDEWQSAESLLN